MDHQTTGRNSSKRNSLMRVTPRRIYQLKKQYEKGKIPVKQPGRKTQTDRQGNRANHPSSNKYKLSPVSLEKLIERDSIHIPHNTIQSFTQTQIDART